MASRILDPKAFQTALHAAEDAFNPFDQQKDATAIRAALHAYLDAVERAIAPVATGLEKTKVWTCTPSEGGNLIMQGEIHIGIVNEHSDVGLVVAAPEMRDALKAHDAYMSDAGYSGPSDAALHPKAAANWRRVRDVLAKIEGEA